MEFVGTQTGTMTYNPRALDQDVIRIVSLYEIGNNYFSEKTTNGVQANRNRLLIGHDAARGDRSLPGPAACSAKSAFYGGEQCDQIGHFIGLWASFLSFWKPLICPNLPHSQAIFVKSIIFLLKSFLGNFYRHLAIFFWSHWW